MERAHRFRVIAQQLEFHLAAELMGPEVDSFVGTARESLIKAAEELEKPRAGDRGLRKITPPRAAARRDQGRPQ